MSVTMLIGLAVLTVGCLVVAVTPRKSLSADKIKSSHLDAYDTKREH